MRQPNSHECLPAYGRKMSNIVCDDIETSVGYVCIGSENDDQIYFGECLREGEDMLKERILITAMNDGDPKLEYKDGFLVNIDLEDVLRFAVKNCHGIYRRVLEEAGY